MDKETKPDVVDTGLTYRGYPVLLGARKLVPRLANDRILTSLDRHLFKYCRSLYEGACDLQDRKVLVEGALPWPDGKGPRSLSDRAEERAHEFVQKCLDEAEAINKQHWYQFWK